MGSPAKRMRFPPFDLSRMPVIDLSGVVGTSTTANGRDPPGGGDTGTTNGGGGGTSGSNGSSGGNAGPAAGGRKVLNKFNRLVPRPDDEPSTLCELSGNSASCFTELCGWSLLRPLKLFNIRSTTHLHLMTNGRGEIIEEAENLKARAISLKDVEAFARLKTVVSFPVFVHVVAKRKVDVVTFKQKLLLIPLIIIADSSGYCALTAINEGLATLYNAVEVGDQLLITKYLPQIPPRTYHRNLFENSMFLDLELKLQFYTVKNHYIRRFSTIHAPAFKMPAALFGPSSDLKLPSELETEFQQPIPSPPDMNTSSTSSPEYYDLIGVVTYAGRIERFRADAPETKCFNNGEVITEKIQRYVLYRWIHLIDRTSSPLPVKVYVTNLTHASQPAIIPGAVYLLSHCNTVNCPYSGKYTTTSHYTQLYSEGNIEKYLLLHPPAWKQKSVEVLASQNYPEITSRPSIQLALGGTHPLKILNPQNFIDVYKKNRHNMNYTIPGDMPMTRRESRRLHFEGRIMRVLKVDNEHIPRPHYVHANYDTQVIRKRERKEYTMIENFYTFPMTANSSWYAFQRKLPEFDSSHLDLPRCRDMTKKICATYKPFIGPLLMPAEMEAYQESGPPPPLGHLEKLDGPPYFFMDIVNEETLTWYSVIWKNRQFTEPEMIEKVESAKDKEIVCWVEVFCSEPEAPLEVNLLDFVVVN